MFGIYRKRYWYMHRNHISNYSNPLAISIKRNANLILNCYLLEELVIKSTTKGRVMRSGLYFLTFGSVAEA